MTQAAQIGIVVMIWKAFSPGPDGAGEMATTPETALLPERVRIATFGCLQLFTNDIVVLAHQPR